MKHFLSSPFSSRRGFLPRFVAGLFAESFSVFFLVPGSNFFIGTRSCQSTCESTILTRVCRPDYQSSKSPIRQISGNRLNTFSAETLLEFQPRHLASLNRPFQFLRRHLPRPPFRLYHHPRAVITHRICDPQNSIRNFIAKRTFHHCVFYQICDTGLTCQRSSGENQVLLRLTPCRSFSSHLGRYYHLGTIQPRTNAANKRGLAPSRTAAHGQRRKRRTSPSGCPPFMPDPRQMRL